MSKQGENRKNWGRHKLPFRARGHVLPFLDLHPYFPVFIHFKCGCWCTIKTMATLTMSLGSAAQGSFEIGPYFNCASVNVHIISHMGFDEGETPGRSIIVRGVISCGNGCWGLIAMAISPLPLGLCDLSQR